MQCNIDARGKSVRLITGMVMVALGVIAGALTGLGVVGPWGWVIVGVLIAVGGFAVFEARAGWCVVRAMGLKTPV